MAALSNDARVTCGAAPVQIEGRLTDGRWFYFRSRHTTAALGASREGPDAAVDAAMLGEGAVRRDLSHLGEHGAGFISIPDAFDLLRSMAAELADDPNTTPLTPKD